MNEFSACTSHAAREQKCCEPRGIGHYVLLRKGGTVGAHKQFVLYCVFSVALFKCTSSRVERATGVGPEVSSWNFRVGFRECKTSSERGGFFFYVVGGGLWTLEGSDSKNRCLLIQCSVFTGIITISLQCAYAVGALRLQDRNNVCEF